MEYFISLGILFSIYGILALSLNMVVGMTGLLSLAQAAFYGIGAYAMALGTTKFGLGFITALAVGIAVNIAVAYAVGKILSRFKGDYYAIVSAGLSIIVFSILMNWQSFTNGPIGIIGIKRPGIAASNFSFFFFCLFFAAAVYALYEWLDRSSFGRCLKAIREDEQLAASLGYDIQAYKSVVFVLSAALTSIAGGLFACYIGFIEPFSFQLKEGIFLFSIIIVGGLASGRGSVLGALILISLPEALRFIGLPNEIAAGMQQIIYGGALVLMMLLRPQGMLGKYRM